MSPFSSRTLITQRMERVLKTVTERMSSQRKDVLVEPISGDRAPGAFDWGVDAILRSQVDFDLIHNRLARAREWQERQFVSGRLPDESWEVAGHCHVCERSSAFGLDFLWSDGRTPNFRERLVCKFCGLSNRQRFTFTFVRDVLRARRGQGRAYIYEQTTPFYHAARDGWSAAEIIGSEYLGHERRSGDVVDGILHQDALALSFADGEFDVIVANDVYEHVPDDGAAFREAARVLADDGRLIFSIPFFAAHQKTRRRARLDAGKLVNIEPPVFHGNPIDPSGSIVFFDYGWDILDRLRESGFRDSYAIAYYKPSCGYIGDGVQLLFVAER